MGQEVAAAIGVLMLLVACWFVFTSIREGERRAALRLVLLMVPAAFLFFIPLFLHAHAGGLMGWIMTGILIAVVFFILWPDTGRPMEDEGVPDRVDERTVMFSRVELVKGTERFHSYYRMHPEHFQADEQFREYPGLLQSGARFEHPWIFAAAQSTFDTVKLLHQQVDGPLHSTRTKADADKITRFLTEWCRTMGAHSVGITLLKPHHLYTYGGRAHNYGKKTENHHRYAIVFTVEMNYDRVQMAPKSPITLESSARYLHAGEIAVQLALMIRKLGYPARAHIDGNYQVRCPQIARDAGLGELGRMSLLITPTAGPRVRIGVVTTDIPLVITPRKPDPSVIDFCRICKKCADACPSQAIPFDDIKKQFGARQWIINQEKCFTYWCQTGTDCGRCISVCPYAHPDNAMHRMIRFFIRKSSRMRRAALWFDDLIYGRKPSQRPLAPWMNI